MNTSPNLKSTIPQPTLLAACLALALGTGTAFAGSVSPPPRPLSNTPTHRTLTAIQASTHRASTRNGRFATSLPSQKHSTHVFSTAASLAVTNCLDDGSSGSLRKVIASASANDTIDMSALTCSTITLSQGQINIGQDNLKLLGSGQDNLTVQGDGTGPVFFGHSPSYDVSMRISDLTITGGDYPFGGCVYARGDITLTNTTVTGCRASSRYVGPPFGRVAYHVYGGGVDTRGNLTMTASTITGNEAHGKSSAVGGGAYVAGSATIDGGSRIDGNTVTAMGLDSPPLPNVTHQPPPMRLAGGAGINVRYGTLTVTDSTISNNRAHAIAFPAYGGGILATNYNTASGAAVTVTRSTISGNVAHSDQSWSYGGGIEVGANGNTDLFPYSGNVDVNYSTISGNAATGTIPADCTHCSVAAAGGGVNATGQISITHSTLSDNRAVAATTSSGTAYGGALASYTNQGGSSAGTISVSESTISGNSAVGRAGSHGGYGRGGGVAARLSPFVIDNSTVAFNMASISGGGIMQGTGITPASVLRSSIVANNQAPQAPDIGLAFPFGNGSGTSVSGSHNLVMFASLNIALPTDTISDDPQLGVLTYHGGLTKTRAPSSTSPALGAGSNPNGDACDQRGVPYSRTGAGGSVDIGAYESGMDGGDVIFANGFELESCTPTPPPP